ncbi:YhgE/Pip domain-containing protein, partial [Streptomyces sp. BF23-30]|uniref:YhgE/Pip domain-containing protein n=1 Tax=Streptomyces sp. BF23-30 TaxID=3240281 RepID=UPI0034E4A8A0
MLRRPQLWIGTGLIAAAVSMLFALLYVGGNVNPKGNLRDLPVALVNTDSGADVNGRHVNLGEQIVSGIQKAAKGDKSIDWQVVSREEADKRLGRGKVFGALVIPADYSATVAALTAPQPAPQGQAAPPT